MVNSNPEINRIEGHRFIFIQTYGKCNCSCINLKCPDINQKVKIFCECECPNHKYDINKDNKNSINMKTLKTFTG
jgi:hypothetical protein